MKEINFCFRNYGTSHYKCGVQEGTAMLTSGLVGGATSIFSGILGSDDASSQLQANIIENEKNRKFNAEEAQKQRDWQSKQWNEQFQKQSVEWYNQLAASNEQGLDVWMKQQEYNSPANVQTRLLRAGLNPAAAYNAETFGGTGITAASPSPPSPSVPSGGVASVSTSNPANPISRAQAFQHIADGLSTMFNALTKGQKDSVETDFLRDTYYDRAVSIILKNSSQELLNAYQDIHNYVENQVKDTKVKRMYGELELMALDYFLKAGQIEYQGELNCSEVLRQEILKYEGKIKNEELLRAIVLTQNYGTMIDNDIKLTQERVKTEKAKQSHEYAAASNLNALTTTENLIRTPKVWAQQVSNSIGRGTMRLQELQEKILSVKLDNEQARNVVIELQRQRAQTLLDDRIDSDDIRQLDDLIYFFTNHFHIGASFNANYGDFNK